MPVKALYRQLVYGKQPQEAICLKTKFQAED